MVSEYVCLPAAVDCTDVDAMVDDVHVGRRGGGGAEVEEEGRGAGAPQGGVGGRPVRGQGGGL